MAKVTTHIEAWCGCGWNEWFQDHQHGKAKEAAEAHKCTKAWVLGNKGGAA